MYNLVVPGPSGGGSVLDHEHQYDVFNCGKMRRVELIEHIITIRSRERWIVNIDGEERNIWIYIPEARRVGARRTIEKH